ncbi:MAG: capsular biosynthesis protein [Rubrimonas sp.]|uniref:capsular polysaccharide export protein, LipB/KpsS family n=1 Tax=Rubrimonas sp. TaxID=2036015 RepID=UPI002FDEB8AA
MRDAALFPPRSVLLLQGPRSPFFARLADALAARGAEVSRVLLCPGDALYWRGRPAVRFRGPPEDWSAFAGEALARTGATDLVALGDGRKPHAEAIAEARARGVAVHIVEQGFLRPGWLTVEPDALGGWRPDPAALEAEARKGGAAPRSAQRGAGFAGFAAMDVAYDLANLALGPLFYPRYRTHALHGPLAEWAGWVGKAARWPVRATRLRAALARIAEARGPVFLVALQLESDFQIRRNGPEGGLRAMLARICDSFARCAPASARLVVKPHPLDPQRAPWRALVARSPAADRAIWLDGGDLDALAPRLAGMVTANSTAGLSALLSGAPVIALGRALYDLPGLTHRSGLDAFWTAPEPPEPARAAALARLLAADIQVEGAFDGPGMGPGAQAVAARILSRAPHGATP